MQTSDNLNLKLPMFNILYIIIFFTSLSRFPTLLLVLQRAYRQPLLETRVLFKALIPG